MGIAESQLHLSYFTVIRQIFIDTTADRHIWHIYEADGVLLTMQAYRLR